MNFTRVNAVTVFGSTARTDIGRYIDTSLLPGGANAAEVPQVTGPVATDGMLFRGQPAALNPATGRICSPRASGAVIVGILVDDITSYVISRGVKVTYQKGDRCRTYAGAALNLGQPVKADRTASYCGVLPWVDGTDPIEERLGHVYPLDDGSATNGATVAVIAARGDQVFLDLIFR